MLAAPQIDAFLPPRRILMGPGPSDVHPQVLAAQARPTVGHLDPLFIGMMDELKQLLQYAFQTKNEMTLAVSAPGSAGMETCFVNLVEPGEKVIVCRNGVFGERMRQNVERVGAIAVLVDNEWGTPVDPAAVEAALKANPDAKFLAFVHAETSTGALSDAKTLCALAKQYGCLSIVDAVTSLGGVELRVDEWGIDAIYSGSQKCLSCVPGLSPVSFSSAAVEKLKNRKEEEVMGWGSLYLPKDPVRERQLPIRPRKQVTSENVLGHLQDDHAPNPDNPSISLETLVVFAANTSKHVLDI